MSCGAPALGQCSGDVAGAEQSYYAWSDAHRCQGQADRAQGSGGTGTEAVVLQPFRFLGIRTVRRRRRDTESHRRHFPDADLNRAPAAICSVPVPVPVPFPVHAPVAERATTWPMRATDELKAKPRSAVFNREVGGAGLWSSAVPSRSRAGRPVPAGRRPHPAGRTRDRPTRRAPAAGGRRTPRHRRAACAPVAGSPAAHRLQTALGLTGAAALTEQALRELPA